MDSKVGSRSGTVDDKERSFDFSSVYKTQAQIKKVFRNVEHRQNRLDRQQKKNNNEFVKRVIKTKGERAQEVIIYGKAGKPAPRRPATSMADRAPRSKHSSLSSKTVAQSEEPRPAAHPSFKVVEAYDIPPSQLVQPNKTSDFFPVHPYAQQEEDVEESSKRMRQDILPFQRPRNFLNQMQKSSTTEKSEQEEERQKLETLKKSVKLFQEISEMNQEFTDELQYIHKGTQSPSRASPEITVTNAANLGACPGEIELSSPGSSALTPRKLTGQKPTPGLSLNNTSAITPTPQGLKSETPDREIQKKPTILQIARILCTKGLKSFDGFSHLLGLPPGEHSFKDLISHTPKLAEELAFLLIDNSLKKENQEKKYGKLSLSVLESELIDMLRLMDWAQFSKLRDGIYTLDQVRARINALYHDVHYKILDDLKPPVLNQAIYDASQNEENTRQLIKMFGCKNLAEIPIDQIVSDHRYQADRRCQRSLYNHVDQDRKRALRSKLRQYMRANQLNPPKAETTTKPSSVSVPDKMVAQRLIRRLTSAQMEFLKSGTVALKASNLRKHPRLIELSELIAAEIDETSAVLNGDEEQERNQRVLQILCQLQTLANLGLYLYPDSKARALSKQEKAKGKIGGSKAQKKVSLISRQEKEDKEFLINYGFFRNLQNKFTQGQGKDEDFSKETLSNKLILNEEHIKRLERIENQKYLKLYLDIGLISEVQQQKQTIQQTINEIHSQPTLKKVNSKRQSESTNESALPRSKSMLMQEKAQVDTAKAFIDGIENEKRYIQHVVNYRQLQENRQIQKDQIKELALSPLLNKKKSNADLEDSESKPKDESMQQVYSTSPYKTEIEKKPKKEASRPQSSPTHPLKQPLQSDHIKLSQFSNLQPQSRAGLSSKSELSYEKVMKPQKIQSRIKKNEPLVLDNRGQNRRTYLTRIASASKTGARPGRVLKNRKDLWLHKMGKESKAVPLSAEQKKLRMQRSMSRLDKQMRNSGPLANMSKIQTLRRDSRAGSVNSQSRSRNVSIKHLSHQQIMPQNLTVIPMIKTTSGGAQDSDRINLIVLQEGSQEASPPQEQSFTESYEAILQQTQNCKTVEEISKIVQQLEPSKALSFEAFAKSQGLQSFEQLLIVNRLFSSRKPEQEGAEMKSRNDQVLPQTKYFTQGKSAKQYIDFLSEETLGIGKQTSEKAQQDETTQKEAQLIPEYLDLHLEGKRQRPHTSNRSLAQTYKENYAKFFVGRLESGLQIDQKRMVPKTMMNTTFINPSEKSLTQLAGKKVQRPTKHTSTKNINSSVQSHYKVVAQGETSKTSLKHGLKEDPLDYKSEPGEVIHTENQPDGRNRGDELSDTQNLLHSFNSRPQTAGQARHAPPEIISLNQQQEPTMRLSEDPLDPKEKSLVHLKSVTQINSRLGLTQKRPAAKSAVKLVKKPIKSVFLQFRNVPSRTQTQSEVKLKNLNQLRSGDIVYQPAVRPRTRLFKLIKQQHQQNPRESKNNLKRRTAVCVTEVGGQQVETLEADRLRMLEEHLDYGLIPKFDSLEQDHRDQGPLTQERVASQEGPDERLSRLQQISIQVLQEQLNTQHSSRATDKPSEKRLSEKVVSEEAGPQPMLPGELIVVHKSNLLGKGQTVQRSVYQQPRLKQLPSESVLTKQQGFSLEPCHNHQETLLQKRDMGTSTQNLNTRKISSSYFGQPKNSYQTMTQQQSVHPQPYLGSEGNVDIAEFIGSIGKRSNHKLSIQKDLSNKMVSRYSAQQRSTGQFLRTSSQEAVNQKTQDTRESHQDLSALLKRYSEKEGSASDKQRRYQTLKSNLMVPAKSQLKLDSKKSSDRRSVCRSASQVRALKSADQQNLLSSAHHSHGAEKRGESRQSWETDELRSSHKNRKQLITFQNQHINQSLSHQKQGLNLKAKMVATGTQGNLSEDKNSEPGIHERGTPEIIPPHLGIVSGNMNISDMRYSYTNSIFLRNQMEQKIYSDDNYYDGQKGGRLLASLNVQGEPLRVEAQKLSRPNRKASQSIRIRQKLDAPASEEDLQGINASLLDRIVNQQLEETKPPKFFMVGDENLWYKPLL